MRHALLSVVVGLSTLAGGCKSIDMVELQPTIEEAPALASAVRVSDPAQSNQLVSGFYEIQAGAWRWTAPQFQVLLAAPRAAATRGAQLVFEFSLPDPSIASLKSVTVGATINRLQLPPETYTTSGLHEYRRDIPASALGAPEVAWLSPLTNSSHRPTTAATSRWWPPPLLWSRNDPRNAWRILVSAYRALPRLVLVWPEDLVRTGRLRLAQSSEPCRGFPFVSMGHVLAARPRYGPPMERTRIFHAVLEPFSSSCPALPRIRFFQSVRQYRSAGNGHATADKIGNCRVRGTRFVDL